jgi:hypothetical protein
VARGRQEVEVVVAELQAMCTQVCVHACVCMQECIYMCLCMGA